MGTLEKAGIICVGCLILVIVVVGIMNRGKAEEEGTNGKEVARNDPSPNRGTEADRRKTAAENEARQKPKTDNKPKPIDFGTEPKPGPAGNEAKPLELKPSPPPVTAEWPKTHEIQAGDNPEALAKRYYNNIALTSNILAANPGLNPKNIKLGSKVVIPAPPPPKSEVAKDPAPLSDPNEKTPPSGGANPATPPSDREVVKTPTPKPGVEGPARRGARRPSFITASYLRRNGARGAGSERTVAAPGGTRSSPLGGGKTHKVVSGDRLGTIAARYYGSSGPKYTNAILAANKSLIKDPDKLSAGWSLTIPVVN